MGEPFGELKIDRGLRQKLLDLCHGQTILLVGDTGAGKSTLINSFFSMITGKYQQIAEARFGHQTVTKTLGKYVCQRADGDALTFVDTCGFIVSRVPEVVPDGGKVNFGVLLDALLSGTIRPETDLHRIIESLRKQNRAETPEEEERLREEAVRLLEAAKVKNERRLEPTTVIVVVDAMFLPPKNYLKAVDEAVMKFSKKVCVVATREDLLRRKKDKGEKQKSKLNKVVKNGFSSPFLITKEPLLMSNYVPMADAQSEKDTEIDDQDYPLWKQELLVSTFEKLLQTP